MILGNTAGVLSRWLGCTGTFAEHPTGTWSPSHGRYNSYKAGYFGGFLASDRMGSINLDGRWLLGYLPTSDNKDPRVLQYRTRLDRLTYCDARLFVWRPYMTPEVPFVADRDIWWAENTRLWTSVCALIYFGSIEWYEVDRMIPQFGGMQNYPHRPLNIN
ncbi:hypothetical protein PIB30_019618 [Stylosanthes scabra]|uniref:Aminotransferase-like plant mobile domain-containing protein n=1 Tax=Stylosanthes scabra TaxID=79078 RepID=A0ABU6R8K2_9FABA|nr:hypothetical protein [Stylosanthes scabra]